MKNYFVLWVHPSCHDSDEWCGIANSYRELLEIYQAQLNSEDFEDNRSFGLELTVFEYTRETGFKKYKFTDEMVLSDSFKNINLNFRFKVIARKRSSLTAEQDFECEKLFAEWQRKLGITRLSESIFVKEETDNTDLSSAGIFASKLGDHPKLFESVIIYDLETDDEAILIYD